ncbi:MAG TPA: ABC transporter ATP-binding protein [Hyphomicrobiaceae bacterium]|nr:ABC transporter ATP-binding protein [Hyphomicrobiaceae bacterium]
MTGAPLLVVDNLHVTFEGDSGRLTEAVAGVSFSLTRGQTLGIVGESGCGKSVTALSIMRLLPRTGTRVSGSVRFEGRELSGLPERQMQDLRGNRLAMIFQEPMTSLNPSFTVGDQIAEALTRHRGLSAKAARSAVIDMLARVRIASPRERVDEYPHKLSGGMRQRIMIAMALICAPALLIADEPTTALDVTIQAQILDLLAQLRQETDSAIMLITHDLGVVAEVCDDVAVMYAGQIVEQAPAARLFSAPQHPYTVGLLGSIPLINTRRERLATISGTVPNLAAGFTGCRFSDRCPFADENCRRQPPPIAEVAAAHFSRCWKAPLEALVA